ncbi:hypothetical protein AAGG60_21040, partial [Stenotrophomonas maltophilia]
NYRPAVHAGNHADVVKPCVQLALRASVSRRDSPGFGRVAVGGAGQHITRHHPKVLHNIPGPDETG